jgi:hypothetical protein
LLSIFAPPPPSAHLDSRGIIRSVTFAGQVCALGMAPAAAFNKANLQLDPASAHALDQSAARLAAAGVSLMCIIQGVRGDVFKDIAFNWRTEWKSALKIALNWNNAAERDDDGNDFSSNILKYKRPITNSKLLEQTFLECLLSFPA